MVRSAWPWLGVISGTLFLSSVAAAQPQPGAPPAQLGDAQPGAVQPGDTHPGVAQPGDTQPGDGTQPPGYGTPAPGPPPPPKPSRPSCCRWSIRFNPFDLLFRRLTFEGEVAVIGPLALEITPSWIWGSSSENLDASGFALAGNVVVYVRGDALKGFWVKGHAGFESFEATLTHPYFKDVEDKKDVSSVIVGGMLGSTTVFGRNGGFAISGGIGIGVALADTVELTANPAEKGYLGDSVTATYYDKVDKIQLLGSLALGVAF